MRNQNFNLKIKIEGDIDLTPLITDFESNSDILRQKGFDLKFKANQNSQGVKTTFLFESNKNKNLGAFFDEDDLIIGYSYTKNEKDLPLQDLFGLFKIITTDLNFVKNIKGIHIKKEILITDENFIDLFISKFSEEGECVELVRSYFKEKKFQKILGYFGEKIIYRDDFEVVFQGEKMNHQRAIMKEIGFQFMENLETQETPFINDLYRILVSEINNMGEF